MKPAIISAQELAVHHTTVEASLARAPLRFDAPRATTERADTPGAHLTPRQLEVLALLCEGLPNKLICRRLNIASGTVKVHISGILRELGVTSRLQAVVSARRFGLVGDMSLGETNGASGSLRFMAAA